MKCAVICNPNAGKGGERSLEPALHVFQNAGWDLSVSYTSAPGDATRMAQHAVAEQKDAVLIAGGDGTINEAIQALAGSETALGYLPYGTVNIWARELAIPLDLSSAAGTILNGRIERVDLGCANRRYFLLMAGIGFDGEVVRRARSLERHKGRLGILPYIASGLSAIPTYRGADIELRFDGVIRRVQALMLILGNTRLYGGFFHLTPNAVVNDGWLDVCVVKGRGPFALARQSIPVLVSRSVSFSDVDLFRVRAMEVQTDVPLPFQLDGELAGTTPVEFRVEPRALKVIVPQQFVSSLIA